MAGPGREKDKNDSGNALTRALRFEKTGMKFFTMAASKSADPYARQVFELLAQMERKHMEDIMAVARRLEEEGKFPPVPTAPHDGRMRLFKREHAKIRREKVLTGDAATAMRRALGFEAEGREMYQRMAKAATHPQEKRLFRFLAEEEESHFRIIYEYLDFMENQGLRMGE